MNLQLRLLAWRANTRLATDRFVLLDKQSGIASPAATGVQAVLGNASAGLPWRAGLAAAIVGSAAFSTATGELRRQRKSWLTPCACSEGVSGVKLRAQNGHIVSEPQRLPDGLISVDHLLEVPLDHAESGGPTLTVFVRELKLAKHGAKAKDLPYLIFLQGGPGFPPSRPTSAKGGWLQRALEDHRVLLLDQRGTGRSAPVTAQTLQHMTPEKQAEYLSHFRADSIVLDCEHLRRALGAKKVALLGQSFGGFCALTYLSKTPESLSAVYITGGLAPVLRGAEDVYRCTFRRVLERNRRYYRAYPGDVQRVRDIVQHLEEHGGVPMPEGGVLTPRRFLSLGLCLGFGGGLEEMHWLVEDAFVFTETGAKELDYRFLTRVARSEPFLTNPIFWLLHEAIYCGPATGAARWAAHRVQGEPEFKEALDYKAALSDPEKPPVMFTGEMVYPWFKDDFAVLPALGEAAEALASKEDWPALYHPDVLRNCKVPVAATMYYEDMYVEFAYCQETAALLGDNCKVWVTNEYQHSGLRDGGTKVLDTLIKMAKGEANIPS